MKVNEGSPDVKAGRNFFSLVDLCRDTCQSYRRGGAIGDHYTDQASRRYLPGKCFVRSLTSAPIPRRSILVESLTLWPSLEPPTVNGFTDGLLYNNPNALNTLNGTGAANPFRLDRSEAATADQDHDYTADNRRLTPG